jgi:hypothetical protein
MDSFGIGLNTFIPFIMMGWQTSEGFRKDQGVKLIKAI